MDFMMSDFLNFCIPISENKIWDKKSFDPTKLCCTFVVFHYVVFWTFILITYDTKILFGYSTMILNTHTHTRA